MFNQLKKAVQDNFNKMSTGDLFYVTIDRDLIWEKYLSGFVEEERQSHNCNCCKSFLRQWSGIVGIVDGEKISIWDDIDVTGYNQSLNNLSEYIHSLPITDVFLNDFAKCGTDKNRDGARNVIWEHLYIELPSRFVIKNGTIDAVRGEKRTDVETLTRAITDITAEATETVLELIAQDSIYKGKEFEALLFKFLGLQKTYYGKSSNFVWAITGSIPQSISRIRNSSIGTLLVNLSEGMDLDTAVAKFEQMVAPTNYKRPTALVSPKMVEQAKTKLAEMGLTGALERRFANESDLHTENILYVDKSSSITDVFDEVSKEVSVNPRTFSKTEEISIVDFVNRILPGTKKLEVLLENKHLNNMVTLLTAADPETPSLFKWDNPFSWSYTGGITDSIKERVKTAGGNVEGVLRVSLSWFNIDDLDLHVYEPNGNLIYFGDKRSLSSGFLDIDMNAGGTFIRNAVENIAWTDQSKMLEGKYKVIVNNFSQRESADAGYDIQIEYAGEIFDFTSRTSPRTNSSHNVVEFNYSSKDGLVFPSETKSTASSKEKWAIKTNQFHKVKNIMLSPNYWEKQIGNKHFLLFLEGCVADEKPRPFFNEFLKDTFTENRKVFEILGSKVKVEPTNNQLSGIGFSDTVRNDLIVKVQGKFTRTLKIII